MKSWSLLFCAILASVIIYGQDKVLSVYDSEVGRTSYLKPENKENLVWRTPNGYTYNKNNILVYATIDSNEKTRLVSLDKLNKQHEQYDLRKSSSLPVVTWVNEDIFRYTLENQMVYFDVENQKISNVIEIPLEAENTNVSPSNSMVAYTVKNDLFVNDTSKGEIAIAEVNDDQIEFGKAVHRFEFGISKGIFWSPKSNALAFYRNDQSEVTGYPLVDLDKRPAEVNFIKYPMAGMRSEHVTIGVHQFESGKTTYLKTGEPKDKYLTNVQWSPDGQYIYIAEVNRDQNHMKLQRYDAKSGELDKTLFEEKHDKYIEPQHPVHFVGDDRFIWQTNHEGYSHLYLYDTSGELIRQLTKGNWNVLDYVGKDKKGKNIFFTATKDSPIEENIYAVNIKSGKIDNISNTAGVHNPLLNSEGLLIIDSFSSKSIPRKIVVLDAKGNVVKNILNSENPLKEYNLGKTIISTIKAADNETDLYYRMVLPSDFDSTRSYPVIVYVYNGPHVQLVKNSWIGRTELWQKYMAQHGYISFTLDGRGSANRGLEFENVTFRQLGVIEMEDQMKGVEFLKSLPYIDDERMGVFGWSYGGFMTTSMMVNYPEVFKVGVAGGPVMDWKFYEVMYTERYMDTPQKNPAGYEKTSLLDKASNLEGKLLIIHGAQDPVVLWQHSLKFIRSAIENRKQLDYFVYPTHEHNVQGVDRVHLTEKVSQYFLNNL